MARVLLGDETTHLFIPRDCSAVSTVCALRATFQQCGRHPFYAAETWSNLVFRGLQKPGSGPKAWMQRNASRECNAERPDRSDCFGDFAPSSTMMAVSLT